MTLRAAEDPTPEPVTWCERKRIHGALVYTRTTETGGGGFKVENITEAEWRIGEFSRLTDELNRLGQLRDDYDEQGFIDPEDFFVLLDVAETLRSMFDDIPGGHPFEVRSE